MKFRSKKTLCRVGIFDNLAVNDKTQGNCDRRFTEILPRPAMGLREYGQSDDWRAPGGNYPAFGRFLFTLAYQPRSVIAGYAFEKGQPRSEISACKLSERESLVLVGLCRCFFFFWGGFFFFFFTVL